MRLRFPVVTAMGVAMLGCGLAITVLLMVACLQEAYPGLAGVGVCPDGVGLSLR